MNSNKTHLIWIDNSDSDLFQTNLPSQRLKSEDTEAILTHSEVTSTGIFGKRIKVDYRADGWDGTYTIDLNLEEDTVEGGEFWNDGEGKRTLYANLYGRCFRNMSEIVVIGTYKKLEDTKPTYSFILRVETTQVLH
jgi:hypothetical protein